MDSWRNLVPPVRSCWKLGRGNGRGEEKVEEEEEVCCCCCCCLVLLVSLVVLIKNGLLMTLVGVVLRGLGAVPVMREELKHAPAQRDGGW